MAKGPGPTLCRIEIWGLLKYRNLYDKLEYETRLPAVNTCPHRDGETGILFYQNSGLQQK
jgi:hypothetical protein